MKAVKFDPLFWRGFVLHMVRVCVSFGICSCIVDYFVTSEICRKWLNQPFFTFQLQLLYCRFYICIYIYISIPILTMGYVIHLKQLSFEG